MPLYEYKCKCGHVHSEIGAVGTGRDSKECPACGGLMRRDWGGMVFRFRSPGWKPYSPETAGRDELVKEEMAIG